MKFLKYIPILIITTIVSLSCSSSNIKKGNTKEEPVVIKNDSLEYEIIIIDPGFTAYLNSIARPVGFYSQSFLETRNRMMVPIWNMRVQNPTQFNPNIYENIIDYSPHIDYGYDVNYKLFNYFMFAQRKYNMRLGNFSNRNL
ncbi:hypothetical protein WH52_11710 [Tenacibaculum holothuriorum]|uniref:Lipoprotein n=1 Tax=Tenacibaculum holothuriorum TaxID=1635173 RepID=A0A1Y2PAX3_9FLAO|nr:DUF6146 family protein [Tenacibaculum holothuriorum]OSY87310.1 hypothetical protein WH52_11710 [Tenacibaculum holothuriorum]